MTKTTSHSNIFTISQLNRAVRTLLENHFEQIWIEGEISGLSTPRSGHIYFALKDEFAQVRSAMFRMRKSLLLFNPENGLKVLARARVGLYEERGDYQLVIDHMEPAGSGLLRLQFEQLRDRLEQEGLFAVERKRPLPLHPLRIGIVTSPTGAAIHDILAVLKRRSAQTRIIIYPALVQGDQAANSLIDALKSAYRRNEVDLLILTRGGGSPEDLQAFNDEGVARTLAQSPIPTISAVGHEIDISISDLVADQRAPTPSAAAELLSRDNEELHRSLSLIYSRLQRASKRMIRSNLQKVGWLRTRVQTPRQRLQSHDQHLDDLDQRLNLCWKYLQQKRHYHAHTLYQRLQQQHPVHEVARQRERLNHHSAELIMSIELRLQRQKMAFENTIHTLNIVSPLATLDRGYSITTQRDDTLCLDSASVPIGTEIKTRLAKGTLISIVNHLIP